jgi:1,2-diacylglycerol 3-alpha-glucosyltransferase
VGVNVRVLMVSDVYFPRVNGVSTSIATFRDSLAALGHRCLLVAPSYGADGEEPDLARVAARRIPFDPEDRLMRRGALRAALERIDPRGIDLVHLQTPFMAHAAGLAWARRHGLPVVETYHTHFEEYFHHYLAFLPRAWLKAAARALSRRQCNALDAVIVPSRAMADVLRGYGVEAPLHVLPTGIDLPKFATGDGAGFRRLHGLDADQPVLVHVGRLAHEKNIGLLLEMLAILRRTIPRACLLVAGEGPAAPHLRSRAVALGLEGHVRFVGYLDRRGSLQDCYRAGDLFVFSSKTETQGLVLLESLALGVPLVALPALGARDIVEPGRGAAAAPEDAAGFAAVVESLLLDPGRRSRMALEAVRFAAEWDTTAVAGRLARLYEEIAAGAPPRREPASVIDPRPIAS